MIKKQTPNHLLEQLPKKWAVAAVIALIGYTLVQPAVNQRLGWNLPSLSALIGQDQSGQDQSGQDGSGQVEASKAGTVSEDRARESSVTRTTSTQASEQPTSEETSIEGGGDATRGTTVSGEEWSGLKYGLLREVKRDEFVSPAGLRYTRGSEEGHRLKHVEKHLKDEPTRPGKHGVFYGDMPQVLRWLDDGYTRAKRGAKGAQAKQEGNLTVYEVPFDKPIGFVGGRDGGKNGNPEARRLRIVVDSDRVITAFPF